MPIVFACIAPHSGNLLRGDGGPTPIPQTREAMQEMRGLFADARPDAVAIITPHGNVVDGAYSLGETARCAASQVGVRVEAETDLELVSAWAGRAAARGVPVAPLRMRRPETPLPLDWGAYIPLHLLCPWPDTPLVAVACPSTSLSRPQLVAWGEALVDAADQSGRRVALIVSADQGHGHAADGPYGFAAASAEYDAAMTEAVQADDLPRLLAWDDSLIEAGLVDSYWQTLALIGVQRRVPLRSRFLSYEVDHYFGLLCAAFVP